MMCIRRPQFPCSVICRELCSRWFRILPPWRVVSCTSHRRSRPSGRPDPWPCGPSLSARWSGSTWSTWHRTASKKYSKVIRCWPRIDIEMMVLTSRSRFCSRVVLPWGSSWSVCRVVSGRCSTGDSLSARIERPLGKCIGPWSPRRKNCTRWIRTEKKVRKKKSADNLKTWNDKIWVSDCTRL